MRQQVLPRVVVLELQAGCPLLLSTIPPSPPLHLHFLRGNEMPGRYY